MNKREAFDIKNDRPTPNNPKIGTKNIRLNKLKITEKPKLKVRYFDFFKYFGPISTTSLTMSKPLENAIIPIK